MTLDICTHIQAAQGESECTFSLLNSRLEEPRGWEEGGRGSRSSQQSERDDYITMFNVMIQDTRVQNFLWLIGLLGMGTNVNRLRRHGCKFDLFGWRVKLSFYARDFVILL